MSTKYYITRGQHSKTGEWFITTTQDRPTLKQAKEQHRKDIAYFYNHVKLEIVKLSETVVGEAYGTSQRSRATGSERS